VAECVLKDIRNLYHGSTEVVKLPDVVFSKKRRDFGRGFYVTQNSREASDWARIRARQFKREAYLNTYSLRNPERLSCYCFDKSSRSDLLLWIDYILFNRGYLEFADANPLGEDRYDVVVGSIADNVLAQVFDDLISYRVPGRTLEEVKENFIGYLEIDRLDDQFCFKTKAVEKALEFRGAERCN
jgi:hypothetical protein